MMASTKDDAVQATPSTSHDDEGGHDSTDRPFSETTRWCLGALKNLTRPGKLAPSNIVVDDERIASSSSSENDVGRLLPPSATHVAHGDASAVASRAILDAGILPVLLRALPSSVDDGSDDARYYLPNTPFDQALSVLMHMTSVPGVRRTMREEYGCAELLADIVVRGKETIGNVLLRSKDDTEVESMRQLSLQCLKAVSMVEKYISYGTFSLPVFHRTLHTTYTPPPIPPPPHIVHPR